MTTKRLRFYVAKSNFAGIEHLAKMLTLGSDPMTHVRKIEDAEIIICDTPTEIKPFLTNKGKKVAFVPKQPIEEIKKKHTIPEEVFIFDLKSLKAEIERLKAVVRQGRTEDTIETVTMTPPPPTDVLAKKELSPKNILIVDSIPSSHRTAKDSLVRHGIDGQMSRRGAFNQIIAAEQTGPYDAVITDLSLLPSDGDNDCVPGNGFAVAFEAIQRGIRHVMIYTDLHAPQAEGFEEGRFVINGYTFMILDTKGNADGKDWQYAVDRLFA